MHVALIALGNAVALMPGLMSVRRRPRVRVVDLPGSPRRTVFTATRAALVATPRILACREALAAAAHRESGLAHEADY